MATMTKEHIELRAKRLLRTVQVRLLEGGEQSALAAIHGALGEFTLNAAESATRDADEAWNAAIEAAAKVAEDYDGEGLHNTSYDAQLGDARQTMRDIRDEIRALKGKRQ